MIISTRPIFTKIHILCVLIVLTSIIPVYNQRLNHLVESRYDFSFQTLFLEYFFVFLLFSFVVLTKQFSIKDSSININNITKGIILYVLSSFLVNLLSIDIYRSFVFFFFGMIGPFLLYLIIAHKTNINEKNFKLLLNSFLIANILFLIISYVFSFKGGFTKDLLEFRSGGNIFGSNSVIGSMSFILPLVFANKKKLSPIFNRKYLLLFSTIGILWILIALSRWGYVSSILTFILVTLLVNKNLSVKKVVLMSLLLVLVLFIFPDFTELIQKRFIGEENSSGNISIDAVYQHTLEEGRIIRWNNGIKLFYNNPFWGVGIGNNYIVDPFGSPDAHNLFINMLIEQGVFVFIIYLFLLLKLTSVIKKIYKSPFNGFIKDTTLLLGIGIIIFNFWAFTGSTFIQSAGVISAVKNYWFFISMGLFVYSTKLLYQKSNN